MFLDVLYEWSSCQLRIKHLQNLLKILHLTPSSRSTINKQGPLNMCHYMVVVGMKDWANLFPFSWIFILDLYKPLDFVYALLNPW